MKRSKPFYLLGLLVISIIFMLAAFFCFTGFAKNWREEQEKKMWNSFFNSIDWENFPWEDFPWDAFPWDSFENFPWDQVPWDQMPWDQMPDDFPWDHIPWSELPWNDMEHTPWDSIPWDKFPFDEMPDDFPWNDLPWDDMPDDFPWNDVPWDEMPDDFNWDDIPFDEMPDDFPWGELPMDQMPDDFPYDKVPWEDMPEDYWENFPWEDLPENFPWFVLPWILINPDMVPDGVLPDDFYPPEWEHEHQFVPELWIMIYPPTCGTPGQEQNVCLICREVITREIPPTGDHVFGDDGVCTVCGMHRIILKSADIAKEYDGSPLNGDSELLFAEGSAGLLAGHYINYEGVKFAECDIFGKAPNYFEFVDDIVIVDGDGNDVSDKYAIEFDNFEYGMLVMNPRRLTITTASDEAKFDDLNGSALKCEEFTADRLLQNHHIIAEFGDGQSDYGTCENEITNFIIVDEEGNDVTSRYSVTFEFGTLTVN